MVQNTLHDVASNVCQGLLAGGISRQGIGCHVTRYTRVQNVLDDVASNMTKYVKPLRHLVGLIDTECYLVHARPIRTLDLDYLFYLLLSV
jgi:hypothetical protein